MILDMHDFVAKWDCGNWSAFWGWLNIISNLIITLAYYTIPYSLMIIYLKRKKVIPKAYVVLLFVTFITFCGTTHLFQAIVFWYPVYYLSILIDFATAIVSIATAIILPYVIIHYLQYKTPEEYKIIQEALQYRLDRKRSLIQSLENINNQLSNRVNYLEALTKKKEWLSQQELSLSDLKQIAVNIRKEIVTLINGG